MFPGKLHTVNVDLLHEGELDVYKRQIIGDFTGKIGDPTGKSKARKALTTEQVLENAKTYEEQMFKVLDKKKTKVNFNSEWLSKMNFEDVIRLGSKMTVARMLEREDFKKRYENQMPIGLSLIHIW